MPAKVYEGSTGQRSLRLRVFLPAYGLALVAMGTVQRIMTGPLGVALQFVVATVVYALVDKTLHAFGARRRRLRAHDPG